MKIRTNFVSNSSSCSFILCKDLVAADVDNLREWYKKQPEHIDDLGKQWIETKYYISARVGYVKPSFLEYIKDLGISEEKVFFVEGLSL